MKFNSQICTTRVRSERLLALGLKKETADMSHTAIVRNHKVEYREDCSTAKGMDIPAWSLSRLLCMLSSVIPLSEEFPSFDTHAFLRLHTVAVSYEYYDYDGDERILVSFNGNGFFAAVVDAIEWLIKEGYFNKEYLNDDHSRNG